MTIIEAEEVPNSDLLIDAIYKSANHLNAGGDVLSKLFKVSNSGGFRKCGQEQYSVNYVVLYTTGEDKNWVDKIDLTMGIVEYFGDNKKPGKS